MSETDFRKTATEDKRDDDVPLGMSTSNDLLRIVLVVVLALLAFPLVMMVVAAPFAGGMHGGGDPGMWGTGGTGLGWLVVTIPALLLLLVLGYAGYRLLGSSGDDPAMAELRRAYARGELTDEEYETRRERLEGDQTR